MSKIDDIEEAIENRYVISCKYDGLSRVVEPHHYGTLGEDEQLHCYQTDGKSSSGKLPEWRNFVIDKVTDLEIKRNQHFEPRKDHNPDNSNYSHIEKSVTDAQPPRPR